MIKVRWGAVVFGLVQALTFYRPYPEGMIHLALALVGFLAVGNLTIMLALRRVTTHSAARNLSLSAVSLDVLLVLGFTFVYTFDPETAIWALIYILPLEGAIRFQAKGALGVMAAATILYFLREVYGTTVYGNEFLLTSISFRMGIGFIIATVAGATASSLLHQSQEMEERARQLAESERELEGANSELAEANQALKDFVSIASHDIRTPLTVISGFTQLMKSRWDRFEDEQKREFVDSIDRQSHYLLRLADDLLTTSRIDAGVVEVEPGAVSVRNIVEEAAAHYRQQDVEVDVPLDLMAVCDPSHLTRILSNYLGNAVKYGEAPFVVRGAAKGEFAEIRVIDHGNGVDPEFVPKLFEKFARNGRDKRREEKGTGLGLAIVRGLADANNGSVWYEPNFPKGSAFAARFKRPSV